MAECLDERDDLAAVEDRDRHTQVGQVPDATLGEVHVVVEEHVTGHHPRDRIVPDHRLHQRRVRPAGELAHPDVVDPGPEVVRVADHRGAGGAADRGLHLRLHRRERSGDDLDQDGIDGRWAILGAGHGTSILAMIRLPKVSTVARKPGSIGTVDPNSCTTAGPSTASPAASSVLSWTDAASHSSLYIDRLP